MNYHRWVSLSALVIALAAAPAAAQNAETHSDAAQQPVGPASPPDAAGTASGVTSTDNEVIVTGTRAGGITAAESAAPIKLLSQDAIAHVGQPNLNQVLTQLVPSFTSQGFGGDTANLTLSASLRGLNPNETLVLVNGKRLHGTANLQILASPFQGGAAPDLDYVTPGSIGRIEVLEDGASAQYGSDAIAGVINIILKNQAGGLISATGGQYYAGDGKTGAGTVNYGIADDRGYLNLTGFFRYHDFSNRGKYDIRIFDPATGTYPAGADAALVSAVEGTKGYPNLNYIVGDARSKFGVGSYNAGYDLTDGVTAYSFGNIGFRRAESYENYRLPTRVVGSDVLGVAGVYDTPGAVVPRPQGFEPQEALRELSYQFVAGVKGDLGDWHWDLSSSYGADHENVHTLQSLNSTLFVNTHDDQSNFYDGYYRTAEWTSDLDLTRKLGSIGTLAAGAEYRRDTYTIGAGEPNSYYGTGAQSFPGFNPLAAGFHTRHNVALYGDIALQPVEQLKLDGAVRYEHYNDFGSKTTWKATGRYDFTDAVALRGTVSTGFRAPTLAEEWYTAVNVAPTSATAQLAANSAAAKVLGIDNLRPETATNFSVGTVLRPMQHLTLTVDAYQIRLKHRIVGSGSLSADPTNPADPVSGAIAAAGVDLEAGLPSFVSAFVNGPTTRSRGVDVVASYNSDLGQMGHATFTLSGTYNKTSIRSVPADPAIIAALAAATDNPTETLFNPQTFSFLTSASPHWKIIGGVSWDLDKFNVTARETYYSRSVALLYNDADLYDPSVIHPAFITDLELGYHLTPRLSLALGANNLFNKKPAKVRFDSEGVLSGDTLVAGAPYQFGPYGINGGYYYARIDFKI